MSFDLQVLVPLIVTGLGTIITAISTAIIKVKKATDNKITLLTNRINTLEKHNNELLETCEKLKEENQILRILIDKENNEVE